VKYIIVFEGVNDIGNRFGPPRGGPGGGPGGLTLDQPQITAEQMIAGYKQIVARAHEKGIKVIGSPIGPYMGAGYWTEEGEAARQTINDWIVNSGTFDGVVRARHRVRRPGRAAADARRLPHGRPPPRQRRRAQGGRRFDRPRAVPPLIAAPKSANRDGAASRKGPTPLTERYEASAGTSGTVRAFPSSMRSPSTSRALSRSYRGRCRFLRARRLREAAAGAVEEAGA
jgi:hypothetical protein